MTAPWRTRCAIAATILLFAGACATSRNPAPRVTELRGTWITTTANHAVATPDDTANTMRRLAEIGTNTVYVEVWKNGYTQFPSEVLTRTIGVDRNPGLSAGANKAARDLLQEMLIEAHRNGLVTIAWFEYGFMAAHQSTMNHLRQQKPDWLSRDINGNDVAPNGFVWLNPVHPDARKLLLELVLEAIDKYDLDGIQFDDRIVWPHVSMGYDDYTQQAYAREHNGQLPPRDARDPAWMRWRAEKVKALAKELVQAIRVQRPGLVISLSPAVYPWSWENYLVAWPQWAAWSAPSWDEFVPQAYRLSYDEFEKTWQQQIDAMKTLGANRQRDLIAGIRIVGDGKDSSWEQLRDSIALTRRLENGGHVLWFSRGVLDLYPTQLREFYAQPANNPHFPAHWRRNSLPLFRAPAFAVPGQRLPWQVSALPPGRYRLIGQDESGWHYIDDNPVESTSGSTNVFFNIQGNYRQVELVVDRRLEMQRPRRGSPLF